jgi:hypothetical protein
MRLVGEKPMSGAQRQARYRARLAREGIVERRHRPARPQQQPPDQFPGVLTAGEMLARLGHDFPTMTDAQVAALRAQGIDPLEAEDRDGQPPVDEFGEPLDSS